MTELRKGLPPLPPRMQALPISDKGYPVPAFVQYIDGKPDFRVMRGDFRVKCVKYNLCWLCGEPLGTHKAFVIGPMCAVNRVSSEPPCHRDCAIFGATACPFLTLPKAQRREANLPAEGVLSPGGISIKRNPGVTLVWITKTYRPFKTKAGEGGVVGGWLIQIGDPLECLWFAEGRAATRAEIMDSIDTGLPLLAVLAEQQGHLAVRALREQYEAALTLVPA
jgi:hypothetical protein